MSQLETISREIFTQVRTTIVLNMRFMDMAVFRLKLAAAPENYNVRDYMITELFKIATTGFDG